VKHKLLQKSILIGTIFTTSLLANISGTVFMDYNLNGHQDKDDLGIPYISLHATCDDNSSYQANTNKNGFYEFVINDKINKCRIELNATKQLHTAEYIKNDVHPFVDIAQNNTIYDISVIKPSTYCQNKPDVIIAAYPLYNDNNKTHPQDHGVLFKVPTPPNDIFDNNTSHRTILKIRKELGAIWGLAYDKYHHNIYASSVLMRYVPLHKQQAGAIYKIDANNTMSLFVKLPNKEVGISEKIFPRNLHSLQDYTIEHLIGRAGLGDLDIDEQGQYLYTVNMAKKELLKISTTTKQITKYPIPNPYNKECNSTMVRPWATKVKNGSVYIGSVCENRIEDGIGAAIQKFTDGNFTTVAITNTLRYKRPRGYNPKLPTGPQYQNSNWNNHKHISYPQPILSDIEFTNKGDLILGYSDRAGYMKTREGSHGDIRKMCLNPDGTYTDESTKVAPTNCKSHEVNYKNNPDIYYEYYVGDYFKGYLGEDGHPETAMGALAVRLGDDSIYIGMVDGTALFEAGSIGILDNKTGDKIAAQAVINNESIKKTPNGELEIYGSKSGGIGDVEILCDPIPIEIGDYVWMDINKNGIQDPDELPFENVQVKLYQNNKLIGIDNTDKRGHYYFGGIDNANMLKSYHINADTNYTISIDTKQTYNKKATMRDVDNNSVDNIDNDAYFLNGANIINVHTKYYSNHSYDFGILPTFGCLDIKVFEDDNENNIYDHEDKLASTPIKIKIISNGKSMIKTIPANRALHLSKIAAGNNMSLEIISNEPFKDYSIDWIINKNSIKIVPNINNKCQKVYFSYEPTLWQSIKNYFYDLF
jgi:hypothetical protein